MERYESYKDSGVKWIGEIPEHWEVRKMKYVFQERSQKGFPKLPLLAATQQYGVIKKDDYENRTVVATKGLETLKLVCKNDFVISLRSFEGGIEMSHEKGIISPAYTILTPKKIEPSYFRHLGKSPVFINLLKIMVTGIREGQNIDYNKLKTDFIPLPPKSEQTAIANYLDSVTSKIDEAISQQQKMIDLLNERKQIIIQNAVTKGLDPNAKMKDSGVEWIGEIPEDWEMRKMKYTFKERSQKGFAKLPLLAATRHHGVIKKEDYENRTVIATKGLESFKLVCVDDFVISLRSFEAGIEKSYEKGIISPAYTVLEPKQIEHSYFKYLGKSKPFINLLKTMVTGIREGQNIDYNKLRTCMLPIPTCYDQEAIANYLDSTTSKIDSSISQCNKMISLLQERKQIIINDVVTGKVKVV